MVNYQVLGLKGNNASPEEIEYAFKKKLHLAKGDIEQTLALHVAYGELKASFHAKKQEKPQVKKQIQKPIREEIKIDFPNHFQHNHVHTHHHYGNAQQPVNINYGYGYAPASPAVAIVAVTFLLAFLSILAIS